MATTASTRHAQASGPAAWLQRALARMDRPGWRKFALSMLALGLAFLLAMYSTIFAQQGRVIATGVCALSALGLAAWTAVTAIPYLARRAQIEWLQVTLDYQVTREGWVFILLVLLLVAAGLNTGNNLLYLILASMLAALLVSGILSLAVLNGVEIELDIPEHVFARQPVDALVRLENLKRFFPSFSLTLAGTPRTSAADGSGGQIPAWREVLPRAIVLGVVGGVLAAILWVAAWKWTSNFYGLRVRSLIGIGAVCLIAALLCSITVLRGREKRRRAAVAVNRLGRDSGAGGGGTPRGILSHQLYFPFLARRATVRRKVELEFPRRGRYEESGLDLSTRFPFGFLEKTMHVGISRALLVYPAVKPTDRFFEILSMLTGEIEAYQRGAGHDLYAIRDMISTDSVRHVDWKASARAGSTMVREFAREDDRRVQLVLDTRLGHAPLQETREQFEEAVNFCASLSWHFHELGAQIQFVCRDYHTRVAPAGEIIYDILERLASVQPDESAPDGLPWEANQSDDDAQAFRIICTAMPRSVLQGGQPAHTHFVFFDSLTAN
jgi:uncharacterized protein (DUF58 family)